jgi:hypothetical protein
VLRLLRLRLLPKVLLLQLVLLQVQVELLVQVLRLLCHLCCRQVR